MKFILMLGILLGSLMCSSGVDSLPLGTEAKVEAYLYENGYQNTGFLGGLQFAVASIENNAVKAILGGGAEFKASTNKNSYLGYAGARATEYINQLIAPQGAGEYGLWVWAFDGGTGVNTSAASFRRFFVTGTPGNISFESSVTNIVLTRSVRLPIMFPDAKRLLIRGSGFTHDSEVTPDLITRLTNVSGVVTHTFVHIPREVTTNTIGVVEVTLNDDTVERFFLENGQKVPSVPNLAILTVPEAGPKLEVVGPPGTYIVQCSTNLVDWHPMQTVVVTYAKASAMDGTTNKQKFYRVRVAP